MEAKKISLGQFEANRPHLRAVACRMLGSLNEAEDAVQEIWLRFSQTEAEDITNLGGWLTTAIARICLDMLRLRKARREEPLDKVVSEPIATHEAGKSPEDQITAADSAGLALFVVLEKLVGLVDWGRPSPLLRVSWSQARPTRMSCRRRAVLR